PGSQMAVAVLGIWKAGCAVVVCDGRSPEEMERCLRRTGTLCVLTFNATPLSLNLWDGVVVQIEPDAMECVATAESSTSPAGEALAWLHPVEGCDEWMAISHVALAQRAAHLSSFLQPAERHKLMITGPIESASLQLAEALVAGICVICVSGEITGP